ncbi:hypothetical protein VNO77_03623 [Canavalia gladiata]|uniref:Uncharacterized protein n=1 Tax=Canavalia gladiata TaxID=3824 RepID=A0AAN9N0P9_CANGL
MKAWGVDSNNRDSLANCSLGHKSWLERRGGTPCTRVCVVLHGFMAILVIRSSGSAGSLAIGMWNARDRERGFLQQNEDHMCPLEVTKESRGVGSSSRMMLARI